jgi:hypothetical protein
LTGFLTGSRLLVSSSLTGWPGSPGLFGAGTGFDGVEIVTV